MLGILVLTHGSLGKEFLDAAFRILGQEDASVASLCIEWDQDSASAQEKLRKTLKKLQESHDAVLILTDLFGGTPTNLAMTFYKAGKVEILTGMNLPMLIKAILMRKSETPLLDALAILREKGQSAIVSVSEALGQQDGAGE
ncbi:MAG: hypothetical protein JHC34_02335 [Acidobacteria bacterium]|jgi:PTS system mannose-specific IIA component|nr:hypothetical protein [Acidobacteriota bacterium]